MNIKWNPIGAREMVFFFIIATPFLRGYCNHVCPSVPSSAHPSLCYALSSLTIGRNPTKFGVRGFHMSWVFDSTYLGHPPGAPGRIQRSTIIFEKSISKIFIPNFMFVLKNKRNGIFIMSPVSYSRGWDLGLLGVKIFFYFSKHGRVAYQIEGGGEQNGIQVKYPPYGQT